MNPIFLSFLPLYFVLFSSSLFAQGDGSGPENNPMQTLMMIGSVAILFYFIIWRPEQKRRGVLESQRNALKKGDRATAAGIVGTVVSFNDETIILKMPKGAEIEVLKNALTDLKAANDEAKVIEVEES